jgi:hypothetical protein
MTTSHTTQSVEDYLNDFAGRPEMPGWDETKPNKVADENRDFVWPPEMWEALIQSIFAGFTIPLITICDNLIMDGGNRSVVLMKFRRGEFTVRFEGWEGTYATMTPPLLARWHSCMIPLTIVRNAELHERSQIYENLNRGVRLTTGQLLKNRKYRPLARLAYILLGRRVEGAIPRRHQELRRLIVAAWRAVFKTTPKLGEVATMYQIVVASQFGPDFFHTLFPRHFEKLMNVEDGDIDVSNLEFILRVVSAVDTEGVTAKKKADIFKRFIGAMIYDVHHRRAGFEEKWTSFLPDAYESITDEQLKALVDVGVARANNLTRVQQLSDNVDRFLRGELQAVAGGEGDDDTESDTE